MQLSDFGITLKRVEECDLEMLRKWRNSTEVNKFMAFRDHITIKMQKKWYRSLDLKKNYYFVIYYDDYPVGLTEIKNINNEIGNLGIFIADEESLKIPLLSFKAIFTIIDFAFTTLKLKALEATILNENIRAIRFNQSFGFKAIDEKSQYGHKQYCLLKSEYLLESVPLRRIVQR